MKIVIIAAILFFNSLLYSFDRNVTNNAIDRYNDSVERIQMVRRARLLTKELELLENKLNSWNLHKESLIREFERKNKALIQMAHDSYSGENHWIRRAKKRKREFYQSLATKEEKINNRLFEVSKKLSDLKNEFLFKYAVELTDEEMYHGKRAKVVDRERKIQMLSEYIKYMGSYEELRRRNEKFDEVRSLLSSIPKINQKEIAFDNNISEQAKINRDKMYQYETMAKRLAEEFYNRYHVNVDSSQAAKKFMENLSKAP